MTDYRWNLHENCHAMEHRLTGIFDQGVLDPEQAQRHLRERLRNEAKQMLETTLLHEADEQLAAVRYQRSASRLDQRNGYRKRNLTGLFGEVTLRVPRARHIGLEFSVFAAYERRWREVDALLLEAFVAGASSRKTGAQLARLLGTRLSATTIANLTRALDEQLGAFHTSPIQDQYAGLIVDGMYMTIRGLGPTKRPLIAVAGITGEGRIDLLALRVCYSENSAEVEGLLRNLKSRGLTGSRLRLVSLDGDKGLECAVLSVWGHVRIQECVFHRIHRLKRNARNPLRARSMMKQAAEIFRESDPKKRTGKIAGFQERWAASEPRAVTCFMRQIHRSFEANHLPAKIRTLMTTTSVIEGFFSQLRRRLRRIGALQRSRAAEKWALACAMRINGIHLPGIQPQRPILKSTHIC